VKDSQTAGGGGGRRQVRRGGGRPRCVAQRPRRAPRATGRRPPPAGRRRGAVHELAGAANRRRGGTCWGPPPSARGRAAASAEPAAAGDAYSVPAVYCSSSDLSPHAAAPRRWTVLGVQLQRGAAVGRRSCTTERVSQPPPPAVPRSKGEGVGSTKDAGMGIDAGVAAPRRAKAASRGAGALQQRLEPRTPHAAAPCCGAATRSEAGRRRRCARV